MPQLTLINIYSFIPIATFLLPEMCIIEMNLIQYVPAAPYIIVLSYRSRRSVRNVIIARCVVNYYLRV